MKTQLLLSSVLFLIISLLFIDVAIGQTPQKMSYQAVIRDAEDNLMRNAQIGIQITLLQESPDGAAIFIEAHQAETNVNGLLSLVIGEGDAVAGDLGAIDWSTGPYYIETGIDLNGGTDYSIYGTSELLSVPYAMFAAAGGQPGPQGPEGPPGVQGAPGTSVTIVGKLGSSADLPAEGNFGDGYLIDGELWVWTGDEWENVGNIQGPRGEKGDRGNPGTSVTIVGAVDHPEDLPNQGESGDGYLINGNLWVWVNSGWENVGNIQGPQGEKGERGTSIRILGELDSTDDFPETEPGEGFIIDGYLWIWTGNEWTNAGKIQGPKGEAGAVGPAGPAGPPGPQGEQGEDGTSVTILGSFDDPGDLPLSGELGDGYLIDGFLYVWNGNDWENVGNIQGPQGDEGPQGPIGMTGPEGPQGPQGDEGPQGPIGMAGPEGPQGPQGDEGPQGPIGMTGPEGPQGPQGDEGPQGPIGMAGPEGPQGPQGDEGPQGPIGMTGPEGPQGPQGDEGPQGPQGDEGPQGQQGDEGPQGPIGMTGPEGPQGPQGDEGPQGPIGMTGPEGPQGPQGDEGPQGPQGDEGPQGPIGMTGPEGPQGPQGDEGPQGPIGMTGPEGPQGPQGQQGDEGPQGPIGITGPEGPQGPEGPAGSSLWSENGDDIYYDEGKVGIGIDAPEALLHTEGMGTGEGNVLHVGSSKFPNPGDAPIEGAGTRMMWYPDAVAFRVGEVSGSEWDTDNIGSHSMAWNRNTEASGVHSTAWGQNTIASGRQATSWGLTSNASNMQATAWGRNTEASGTRSTAWGDGAEATGLNATAWGFESVASEPQATAWGQGAEASGEASTAWGIESEALAARSTAWGYQTVASALTSTAWGSVTQATGLFSTAWGSFADASGQNSTAWGFQTLAPSYLETSLGSFNTAYTPMGTSSWNGEDRLFVIGNGPDATGRNDALVLLKNGNLGIDLSAPEHRLAVAVTTSITPNGDGIALVNTGTNNFWNIHMSSDWLRFSANNSNVSYIHSQTGAYVETSDRRLKENIRTVESGVLEKLNQINVVNYNYKRDPSKQMTTGVIAQELEPLFPQFVHRESESSTLGVNYSGMSVIAIQAIQEQQEIIEKQEDQIQIQEKRMQEQEKRLQKQEEENSNQKRQLENMQDQLDQLKAMLEQKNRD